MLDNPPLVCLILMLLANGAPIIAQRLLGPRWDSPLDLGHAWRDGRPILGQNKTWRGLIAATMVTGLMAYPFGLSWSQGAVVGLMAMLGDSLASFIKRRRGLPPGSKATGLDQVPEALLPLLYLRGIYGLSVETIVLLLIAFIALDRALSLVLFRLHIRERPY